MAPPDLATTAPAASSDPTRRWPSDWLRAAARRRCRHRRRVALTAAGIPLATTRPGARAQRRAPHPTLHGTLGELSILADEPAGARPPFVLAAFGVHRSRGGRRFGDLLIATVVTLNTLNVGLAIGHFGTRLLPYLPHLPLEWLALAISLGSAWLELRHPAGSADGRSPATRSSSRR